MKKIIVLLAATLNLSSYACDMHGKSGITIDNDMWIGPWDKNAGGITLEQFNRSIDDVEALYTDIVKGEGKSLKVVRNWDDGTVNAYAKQGPSEWEVHMFGGLARHSSITEDGFALVVCHELGHHLGGSPRKIDWYGGLSWASNEGQADYWGVSKCFRKLLEQRGDSVEVVKKMEVSESVKAQCNTEFGAETEESAICVRSAYAGYSLASLFHNLRQLEDDLDFDTKDEKVARATNHSHPMPQCRLDTYFSAGLCGVASYVDVDVQDPNVGTCNRKEGFTVGVRPLCWFKPEVEEEEEENPLLKNIIATFDPSK